jgi:predicted naringenin-chalcone synthase
MAMTCYLHGIGTAVPPFVYGQDFAMACMKRWVNDRVMARMVHRVYRNSGIARRYSVLPDFQPESVPRLFTERVDGTLNQPATGARNAVYAEKAGPLAEQAARSALQAAPAIACAAITHIITASCTGFANPGVDLHLVRALGLPDSVERYHLGFMGCYAAFPALRLADQICRARSDARVLVVCVELCSLHLQVKPTPDALLANALFADGAAAALVSASPPTTPGVRAFSLDAFASRLVPDSEAAMAWTIGDHGFDMTLSSYVPRLLGAHARPLLDHVSASLPVALDDVAAWAVHPGGLAILAAVAGAMGWPAEDEGLRAAHRVLRDYGNMSSATILFVLADLLATSRLPEGAAIGAMAFGPGLTVESAQFRLVGAPPMDLQTRGAEGLEVLR